VIIVSHDEWDNALLSVCLSHSLCVFEQDKCSVLCRYADSSLLTVCRKNVTVFLFFFLLYRLTITEQPGKQKIIEYDVKEVKRSLVKFTKIVNLNTIHQQRECP